MPSDHWHKLYCSLGEAVKGLAVIPSPFVAAEPTPARTPG